MLFPYTYVPHQMERMQIFIDFIFYEVWCTAPVGLVFHTDLFEGNSDLKEVMVEFGFSPTASARGKRFYKEVSSSSAESTGCRFWKTEPSMTDSTELSSSFGM